MQRETSNVIPWAHPQLGSWLEEAGVADDGTAWSCLEMRNVIPRLVSPPWPVFFT